MKDLYRQKIGKWGETAASEFLSREGCSIVARNIHTPEGEIDLIVELAGEIRFIEVKTRTSRKFGNPEDAITRRKYEHMHQAAEQYLSQSDVGETTWHLDVIAINGRPDSGKIEFEWFRDVTID